MEAMAVLEKQQQFDFQNNGIEVMNFETLQRKDYGSIGSIGKATAV